LAVYDDESEEIYWLGVQEFVWDELSLKRMRAGLSKPPFVFESHGRGNSLTSTVSKPQSSVHKIGLLKTLPGLKTICQNKLKI
jgi:hypothetical protein